MFVELLKWIVHNHFRSPDLCPGVFPGFPSVSFPTFTILERIGTGVADFCGMETVSSVVLEGADLITAEAEGSAKESQTQLPLIWTIIALLLWLVAGAFLTWIVAGFERILAPQHSPVPAWGIGSLFLVSTILVACYQWRCWQTQSVSAESCSRTPIHTPTFPSPQLHS